MKKNKIILVSMDAKYIHTNLAIRYLKTYCNKIENIDIDIKEYTINQSRNYIIADLMDDKPDLICFSCYIWNIEYIMSIAKILKIAYSGKIEIMLGGPEVSFESEKIIENNSYIDYIITGEGEETLFDFLSVFGKIDGYDDLNKDFKDIRGLVYRNNKEIINNASKKIVENLDTIPSPFSLGDDFTNKLVYYETSRGCPFNCSFCMSSVDKTVRYFSMDRVKRDLDILLKSNARTIKFVDRTFNANYKRAKEIIEYIVENNNDNIKVHFEMNADIINDEFLLFMKSLPRNMFQLEIGVQTTNEKTLKSINRREDLQWLSYVVRRLMSYENIHVHVDLIAGLPYEDYQTFSHSFNDIHNLYADKLQLGFLKVLRGTQIYNKYACKKIFYDDLAPYEVIKTEWLSYDEILVLKNIDSLVDKYYNEGYFKKSIRYLIEDVCNNQAFEFYEELHEYWKANKLYLMKPGRKQLYEILVSFSKERGFYEEILERKIIMDYLTNNKKDRILACFDEKIETDYLKIKKKMIADKISLFNEFFEEGTRISVISSNTRVVKIINDIYVFIYVNKNSNFNKQNYSSESKCSIMNITELVEKDYLEE